MIPQFPDFKSIELSDRAAVEAHTNLYEPYSDFNFNCLWAWDADGKRMISELNGNLVVKFTDYETHKPFLSFLGTNDREGTVRALVGYCKEEGLPSTLRLMPDVSILGIDSNVFIIEESRGDFDYILSTERLKQLAGKELQRKKENANRFRRENPGAKFNPVDLSDRKVQQQILETFNDWEHQKVAQNKVHEAVHELTATRRLLENDWLNVLHAVGLFLGEKMIGYAIGEDSANSYAMVHFLKSTNSYKGATEALMQDYAQYLYLRQGLYMNFESDLGTESMRRSKSSWQPVTFLRRYNVRYAHL